MIPLANRGKNHAWTLWRLLPVLVLATAMVMGNVATAVASGVMDEASETYSLEVNKGILIRLDRPATNIYIANPAIADIQVKSAGIIYVFGLQTGETTLYALDKDEQMILAANVRVSQNVARLSEALADLLPAASIEVADYSGMLVLEGHVKSPGDAEMALRLVRQVAGPDQEIINRLAISTPTQINLRVKIAEVSRDVLKTLGFNWDAVFSKGDVLFGLAQGTPTFNMVENPVTGFLQKDFLVRNGGANSLFGNISGNNFDLNSVLDALETEGYLSVLAEPNLTALSGETASFLAGGEFPIPVPERDNIAIEFKEFGVGLTFTPRVISENKINLQVAPEVSQLSNAGAIRINGIQVPALTTRKASTTVELASGQSFAIAGLLQSNVVTDTSKFPWLGDIPILGALFRSHRFQRQETELVIIVTPYIVRGVDARQITLPTDAYSVPGDLDRYLNGDAVRRQARPDGDPADLPGVPAMGGAGFKIEPQG